MGDGVQEKTGDIPFPKMQMKHACKRDTKKDRKRQREERESEAQEAHSKCLWKVGCPFSVLVLCLHPWTHRHGVLYHL